MSTFDSDVFSANIPSVSSPKTERLHVERVEQEGKDPQSLAADLVDSASTTLSEFCISLRPPLLSSLPCARPYACQKSRVSFWAAPNFPLFVGPLPPVFPPPAPSSAFSGAEAHSCSMVVALPPHPLPPQPSSSASSGAAIVSPF